VAPLPLTPLEGAAAAVVLGAALVAGAVRALWSRHRDRRYGALVATDARRGPELVSERYRLVGRPDELRRGPDGRLVPVELKSRRSPAGGPAYSHRVQVWAYCLLLEESTGRAPAFGVVRYSDSEFRIPWDAGARGELLRLRAELDRPYDGRARPSAGRCHACSWRLACDARAR